MGEEMTTARSSRTTRERGFTLLEVLVALAILSLAVVAVIQGFAQNLRLLKLSGDHQRAILLADQKVREVLSPEEQREHGAEAGFDWERVIRRVEAPELALPGSPPRWKVFEIAVRVTWDGRRQVEQVTLRTVPAVTTPVARMRAAPGQNPIPRGGGTP
jgi:general secretion pathway protein I